MFSILALVSGTISNEVGHVKSVFLRFLAHSRTPMHLRSSRPFPRQMICRSRRFFSSMSSLLARSVSLHQLGVAHQTSLRSPWTMMIYSNSLRLREAGSLFTLPVTALQDHC